MRQARDFPRQPETQRLPTKLGAGFQEESGPSVPSRSPSGPTHPSQASTRPPGALPTPLQAKAWMNPAWPPRQCLSPLVTLASERVRCRLGGRLFEESGLGCIGGSPTTLHHGVPSGQMGTSPSPSAQGYYEDLVRRRSKQREPVACLRKHSHHTHGRKTRNRTGFVYPSWRWFTFNTPRVTPHHRPQHRWAGLGLGSFTRYLQL